MRHKSILLIYINLILFGIFMASCTTPKNNRESEVVKDDKKQQVTSTMIKTQKYKGQIVSENFINKGGKEISTIKDLYFQINNGERHFIKFEDSKITFSEASGLLGKEIIISAVIKEGLWDVPDDNPQYAQSRTGLYIVIFEIIKE